MDRSHDHFDMQAERPIKSGKYPDTIPDQSANQASEIEADAAGVGGFVWFMIFFSLFLLVQAMTSSGQGTAAT